MAAFTRRRAIGKYVGKLTAPSGFDMSIPFDIIWNGARAVTTINSSDYKITPLTKYYVTTTGSNANSGLSLALAKRSPDGAKTAGNLTGAAYEIEVSAGTYPRNNSWTTTPTQNFNIIGIGTVIISAEWETKTGWTSSGAGTAYKITRSACLGVCDAGVLTANGDYTTLTLAASQAECESTLSTYYTDNVTVWANVGRNLAADGSQIKLYLDAGYPVVSGNLQGYVENIQFEGGSLGAFFADVTSAADEQQLYFKDSSFKYSTQNNGLRVQGTKLVIVDTCIAAANYLDGFNYHADTTVIPNAIEINCIGRSNGFNAAAPDSNNGSTIHDGGSALSINCLYYDNQGRNIHDVSVGTKRWAINTGAWGSQSTSITGGVNFTCGDATGATMWLSYCYEYGSVRGLTANEGDVIYIEESSSKINRTPYGLGTITTFNGAGGGG